MQAARGTKVTQINAETARFRFVAHPRRWALFATVAFIGWTVDQVTKYVAVDKLTGQPDVSVVGEFLQLHLTYNPGAAFSIGTDFTIWLTCLAIVATLVVLWISRRVASGWWAVSLGIVLAGITGNLTDRLFRAPEAFRGHVVDFLQLPNWPVFNVADMCLNVGAALVLLQAFRGIGLDGSRDSEVDETGEAEPAASEPDAARTEEAD